MTTCALLREYRCTSCKKLLLKAALIEGILEMKCKYCHAIVTVEEHKGDELICTVSPCPFRTQN
ncbi:MAG: hypothetical protein AAB448_05450 [Patescibacteria group bacterium]